MAVSDENSSHFTISVQDFDTSLLPSHARTPGTDAFREEVSKRLQQDFAEFGGWAKIVVDSDSVQVSWRSNPNAPKPLEVVLGKLQRGEFKDAVRLLEWLRQQQPDDPLVLYNLGMALSDMGELGRAEQHLRRAIQVAPDHVDAWVALGVALARQQRTDEAIEVLRQAVQRGPDNPWAHRNLGASLMKSGNVAEAESSFRRALELKPEDQPTNFGIAQVLQRAGNLKEADGFYTKVIDLDSTSPVAEAARDERRKLAAMSFRSAMPGARPDAVMYCLDALKKFEGLDRAEIQRIGFEIAILGQRGLNPNDVNKKYALKNLPGSFTGLHLLCIMFAAFKVIAPAESIGFDVSQEYAVAKTLHRGPTKRRRISRGGLLPSPSSSRLR